MGILWWGEPGPRPMPDRGGRNPAPLAANGRMFVQGNRVLFGMDAYNGTVLWTFFSPEMRRSNIPRDGSNMVATDDTLYITIGGECIALDAQTGRKRVSIKAQQGKDVGWLSANNKQLLTTTVKHGSEYRADGPEWYDGVELVDIKRVVSDVLFSHDATTGKEQWAYRGGAVMNSTITIAEDIIYFVESRNAKLNQSANSRVAPSELTSQYLVALNLISGEKLWEKAVNFSKCENMLYLIHAEGTLIASGSDRDKKYHIYAYDVSSPALRFGVANPEIPELWKNIGAGSGSKKDGGRYKHHGGHLQHPLVVKQTLYSDWRAFDLRSGSLKNVTVPERRGCGNMAASNHSIFYRHHSQTMWDLGANKTTTFNGSRTGCWLGMIPAQGLMLAPESSGGCSCHKGDISIQTSAAWVPRAALKKPEID
jgi:outer membrane protein assembly factor BamB